MQKKSLVRDADGHRLRSTAAWAADESVSHLCAHRPPFGLRDKPHSLSGCVREFDRDGWQASVRRNVAPPASVSLGAAGENAFAVVVPDADCE